MRVANPAVKDQEVSGPFQPIHFDGRGISEEVSADVGHYLCRFPGYKPYKGGPQVNEPDARATKAELLAFCNRQNIGGVSEEMTKREILERIHAALTERRGGRVPPGAEASAGSISEEEEEE